MLPLTTFLKVFLVKLGPKSIKNRLKIDPQSDHFLDQVFKQIFDRFLMDFGAILAAKMDPKSINKHVEKIMKK